MVQEFTDTEAFKAAFNEQTAAGGKFIAWFTGSVNPETGNSWCGDCVVAKPSIDRVMEQAVAGGRKVLKGIVERNEWMGNQGHPYRQAPYGAGGVPTVVLFEGSNSLHKVDDLSDFANEDVMNMFLDEM